GARAHRCAAARAPGAGRGGVVRGLHLERVRAPLARCAARGRGPGHGVTPGSWSGGAKRALLIAAKIAFSAALMAFLFRRIPAHEVGAALRHARPGGLVLAALLLLASNLLGAYQWHRLLGVVGLRIPFWKTCAYYHVGLFFNNFLP